MITRSSYGRACARLVLMLAAFLFWNTLSLSPVAAQGGYPFPIYLYDIAPNPSYEVTSTYVSGHVTDRYNNVIYVTLDQDSGHVYDLEDNIIGFLEVTTAFRSAKTTASTVPMPVLVLLMSGWLWRTRW